MSTELIKISREFKGLMGGVWLGIETTVNAEKEQDIIDAFKEKNELLEKAYMAMNPQIGWNGMPDRIIYSIPTTETEKPSGITIDDINSCQDKITLESYRLLVRNKPELEAAFLSKLKEFI